MTQSLQSADKENIFSMKVLENPLIFGRFWDTFPWIPAKYSPIPDDHTLDGLHCPGFEKI
jgi:hypothetical protein